MIRDRYQSAVGQWGIQPSEFWKMTLQEWWWLFDAKRTDIKPNDAFYDEELWEAKGMTPEWQH